MNTCFQGDPVLHGVSRRCMVFHSKMVVTVVLTVVLLNVFSGSILAENGAQNDRPFVDLFCRFAADYRSARFTAP
jgi:hypothetical protein